MHMTNLTRALSSKGALPFLLLAALIVAVARAQVAPQPRIVVNLDPIERVSAKRGDTVTVPLRVKVDAGFHVNSDKPNDPFLIPIALTWTPAALEKPAIQFPKPETAKLAFSEKPVSIFSGEFEIATKFKVSANTPAGPGTVSGKLRYQACNDRECLIPRTIAVTIPVEIQ